jgi:hypothetical protein
MTLMSGPQAPDGSDDNQPQGKLIMAPTTIIGKYFVGYSGGHSTGVIEAAINDSYYLVRCDPDRDRPEYLAVVDIVDMAGGDGEQEPPAWALFDSAEQRAKYIAWLEGDPDGPSRKFRVVPLKP